MGSCFSHDFRPYGYQNTPNFSLEDKILDARVVDIYDGDTITVVLYIFGQHFKFQIRLSRIDTCEMKSAKNKDIAYKARNRLYELITGKIIKDISRNEVRTLLDHNVYLVKLKCGCFDKYGRLLAEVYNINTIAPLAFPHSFNARLIYEKLAYSYEGKTKISEDEQRTLLLEI